MQLFAKRGATCLCFLMLWLSTLGWPTPSTAQAAGPAAYSYCFFYYTQNCYSTRAEAEAAIRTGPFASDPGTELLQYSFTSMAKDGVTRLNYRVPDQPPEAVGAMVYGSGIFFDPTCAPAVTAGGLAKCASESELVQSLSTFLKRNDDGDCTTDGFTISGSYSPTYVEMWSSRATTDGRMGGITYTQGSSRRLNYHEHCNSSGYDADDATYLTKTQNFRCPVGFSAIAGLPPGSDAMVQSGKWCSYNFGGRYITTKLLQVCSQAANEHPCFPATGDKARSEIDFSFAGRPFVRNYHSVRQFDSSKLAPGWRHSFEESVAYYDDDYYTAYLVDSQGYFDNFIHAAPPGQTGSMSGTERQLIRGPQSEFRVLETNGDAKDFDFNGRLLSITNASTPKTNVNFSYVGGMLSTATDVSGRKLQFAYTAGRLSSIVLPDGTTVQYGYDVNGDLVSVNNAGAIKTYQYAVPAPGQPPQHLLTGIVSENNHPYAQFAYDAQGRVTLSQLLSGAGFVAKTTLLYDSAVKTTVTTETGETRVYNMYPYGGTVRRIASIVGGSGTTSYSIDSDDQRIVQQTDHNGVKTNFGYATDYLATITQAVGTAFERQTTVQKDTANHIVKREQFSKPAATLVLQQSQTYAYDLTGRQAAQCAADPNVPGAISYVCGSLTNAPNGVKQSRYTYCDQAGVTAGTCPIEGLLLSIDGPRTDVIDIESYSYYQADDAACATAPTTCMYRKGDLLKVTNALSQGTDFLKYDGAGRPLSTRDANGVVTDWEYNKRGWFTARKVRGQDPATEADDAITRIQYDLLGQVVKVIEPDLAFLAFTYDDAQRLTDVTDILGNKVHYVLDGAGHRVQEDLKDSAGVVRHSLSRIYNTLGQLKTLADANATPRDFTYDANGNLDKSTDPLGRISDADFDPLNRLTQLIKNTAGIATARATTALAYDPRDNVTSVVDPKGLTTTYSYNAFNDVLQIISPDTGTTSVSYDGAGNAVSQLDGRGKSSGYSYDGLNRIVSQAEATAAQNVYFDYDLVASDCGLAETFGVGRLWRVRFEAGSTRLCYDSRGHVVRQVQTVTGGSTLTTGLTYNAANHLVSMTYPSGAIVSYLRNAAGQITGISGQSSAGGAQFTLVSAATYTPFGPLSKITFGNARAVTYSFDKNYGIDKVADSASTGISEDVTLNNVGNITALVERTTGSASVTRTLTFDGLDRLNSQKNGSTVIESFVYDSTGNRTSRKVGSTTTASTYPSSSHRLATVGTIPRTYDGVGNTTLIGTISAGKGFSFDDHSRLRDFRLNNVLKNSYRYDGFGQRILKSDALTATNSVQYTYDASGHLLGEYTPAGVRIKEYVWLDDRLVAVLTSFDATSYQFVETDVLGSPRAVIHPVKNVIVWRWDLNNTSFGEHVPNGNPDGDSLIYSLNVRFAGQYYDVESAMHYNYFRDYDPATGRYIESDPIGLVGGVNTYAYGDSRPLTVSDPYGLMGITLHPYTMGGNGLESRYEITFDPLSAQDIPGLGGRLRKWGDRIGTAVRVISPYNAGSRRPVMDALKCGVLDRTLEEENPALDGKHLKYDDALAALKAMYGLHPEMSSLYYSTPELFLDAALVKGRSNWQWRAAEYVYGVYKDHE